MKLVKGGLGVIVALLLVGSSAQAFNWSDFELDWDGTLEVSGDAANNESDAWGPTSDRRGGTATRVILGVTGNLAEDVTGRVETVRSPATSAGAVQRMYGNAATNVHTEQTAFSIEQAYVDINDVMFGVNAKLGRQYFGDKENFVAYAGLRDDDNFTVTSIDALHLTRKFGWLNTAMFFAKPQERSSNFASDNTSVDATAAFGQEQKVNALMLDTNVKDITDTELDLSIGFDYWNAADAVNSANVNDNVSFGLYDLNVGLAVPVEALQLNFGLNYVGNTGERKVNATRKIKYKGNLTAFKAGVAHEDVGFDAYFEMVNASGDDKIADATDASDKSFHDLNEFGLAPYKYYGEIAGKSNALAITNGSWSSGLDTGSVQANGQGPGAGIFALGAGYVPPIMDKKLKFMLDYFSYEYKKLPTSTDVDGDGKNDSKDLGSEIDLTISYAKNEKTNFSIGYATFSPEAESWAFNGRNADDKMTKFFANATVKF
ncbi:hypothetical protein ACFL6Y_10345 [Elusimicrobiota bacterium]